MIIVITVVCSLATTNSPRLWSGDCGSTSSSSGSTAEGAATVGIAATLAAASASSILLFLASTDRVGFTAGPTYAFEATSAAFMSCTSLVVLPLVCCIRRSQLPPQSHPSLVRLAHLSSIADRSHKIRIDSGPRQQILRKLLKTKTRTTQKHCIIECRGLA